ncbi:MAG: hypothetical protein JWP45_683 [Mucilaginibacter sp.]|jgi:hypothetical protein|nr:hypothetical protein [Mucilaginibacter sp.]
MEAYLWMPTTATTNGQQNKPLPNSVVFTFKGL